MANSIRKRRGLTELQSNCAFVGRKVSTSAISSTQSLRAAKLHVELHLRPAHPEALEQYFHRKRLTGYRPRYNARLMVVRIRSRSRRIYKTNKSYANHANRSS